MEGMAASNFFVKKTKMIAAKPRTPQLESDPLLLPLPSSTCIREMQLMCMFLSIQKVKGIFKKT